MDLPKLEAGRAYQLRYEFSQKEVLRNGVSRSMQEESTSEGDALVSCHLPFFTQEIVFIDRKLMQQRVRKYNKSKQDEEMVTHNKNVCNFGQLDTEAKGSDEEAGIACRFQRHAYPIAHSSHDDLTITDEKTGVAHRLIHEDPIVVTGAAGRPITQYMQMKFGTEFAFGAGLKVLLRRASHGIFAETGDTTVDDYDKLHPFACLLDKSCQFAWRYEKNHMSMDVVLTTGEYLLQFWEVSNEDYVEWMQGELNLGQVPFTVDIASYPVLQNEDR